MRFFRSLQGKILLFFALINVTTVAVLTVTVSGNAREALETKIEDQLRLKARVASRSINEQLDLKWAFMKSLASNTFMVNSVIDLMGRGEYLEPFMQRLHLPGVGGEQTDVWLLDFAGHIIARNGKHTLHAEPTPFFADEPWWPRVREGHPVAIVSQREGRARLLLAFPVLYQQHTEGAVVAELDVALLRELTARDGFEATLLSPVGPLFGAISSQALSRVREVGPGTGQLSTFVLGDTFYLVEPLEGFTRERGLGWSLVLSVPTASISGPVDALRQRMLGTGVILACLFGVLVVWGTRGLLRPLERMEATMRSIFERGDLSQRIRLESRDELGSIARTFDRMLERLEHHTAELESSRDQLALLAHITSAAPSAIAMLDMQGRVCVWNNSAERLFGWSQQELSAGPFLERVVPPGLAASVAQLLARTNTGVPAEAELSLVTREAGPIPVQVTVTRISDAAGLPTGHVFIVRDQREVKRLRESLVQSEKMAAVGTLVAGLSHELNNPLGIILGFAQGLLRRATLDDTARMAVVSIERQTQRCAQLVRALLDFSRKKVPVRERVAVRALFERVRELIAGQARRGDIQLEVAMPSDELPELEVSVQEIESALLNLVANALDATPGGGSVLLSAQAVTHGSGVELLVRDTGEGMTEEVLQRAFDPFFTTKPVGQGTGLGLSITRSIVEAHGGAIDVKTAPGAGTTVRLWLPAAGAPARAHATETTAWK
ncbi:MAG TPA: ATP-binding protein [Myxococcaceae bacterium]|nr:ATP-binding protein [Myxococcaceae bacterium]